jgi:hypothetical protein
MDVTNGTSSLQEAAKLGVFIVYFCPQPTRFTKQQRRKAVTLRRLRFKTICDPK